MTHLLRRGWLTPPPYHLRRGQGGPPGRGRPRRAELLPPALEVVQTGTGHRLAARPRQRPVNCTTRGKGDAGTRRAPAKRRLTVNGCGCPRRRARSRTEVLAAPVGGRPGFCRRTTHRAG